MSAVHDGIQMVVYVLLNIAQYKREGGEHKLNSIYVFHSYDHKPIKSTILAIYLYPMQIIYSKCEVLSDLILLSSQVESQ